MDALKNVDFTGVELTKSIMDDRSKINKIKGAPSEEDLKEACGQFEAILLNYMFQRMRASIPKSGFLDQGIAFDIVQSMHDEALAEELAKGGGIGLAQQLYDDLSKYL